MTDEREQEESGAVEETPPDYDPLLQQANLLPSFLKGTDPGASHVRDITDGDEAGDPEDLDDGFGYKPPDPSTFTADD